MKHGLWTNSYKGKNGYDLMTVAMVMTGLLIRLQCSRLLQNMQKVNQKWKPRLNVMVVPHNLNSQRAEAGGLSRIEGSPGYIIARTSLENKMSLVVVALAFNPSTREAEAGGSL